MTRRVRISVLVGVVAAALVLLGVCLVVWLSGSPQPSPQPRAGTLRILKAGDTRAISFEYGRDLIDLYSMFPACRNRPSGDSQPSWKPGYQVVFEYKDDPTVRLVVSSDGRLWTRGRGDFAVHGDLGLFLRVLPTTELMRLLRSHDETEQAKGNRGLAEEGAALMDLLMASVQAGNPWQQREAARRLRFLVSPWVRNGEGGMVGAFSFRRIDRNVERPVSHPKAPEIRTVCLDALRALLAQYHEKARQSEDRDGHYFDSGMMGAFADIAELLSEVGDEATIDLLARMLSTETERYFVSKLMACVDLICGLPPSYEPRDMCPVGEPRSRIEAFRAQEDARCNRTKDALLDWLHNHWTGSREDKIRAALSKWDGRIVNEHAWKSGPGLSATIRRLSPIIRMGEPALPMTREKRDVAEELAEKGRYEFVIAYVTGELDAALVRQLLGGAPPLRVLACQIIAAAESREWRDELDRLQYERGYVHCESLVVAASEALAVCHHEEALPLLRRALERQGWNLVAKNAVDIFERRAREGRLQPQEDETNRR